MRAILSPESFIDNYLYPIWEFLADIPSDIYDALTASAINRYVIYLIVIDVLVLPFAFWLVMSFLLSYRSKKLVFFTASKLKDFRSVTVNNLTPVKAINQKPLLHTFSGTTRYVGASNKYLGTFSGTYSGTLSGSKVSGTLNTNNLRSAMDPKYKYSLMPYHFYSTKFLRYPGAIQEYNLNANRWAFFRAAAIALRYDEASGTKNEKDKIWSQIAGRDK